MAASLIEVTVLAYNNKLLASSQTKLLPTAYMQVTGSTTITAEPKTVTGANSTIFIPSGIAGGGVQTYVVAETQAQVLAAANADSVVDLSVVGTLDVTGFTTLGAGVIVKREAVAYAASATQSDGDMKKGYFTNTGAAGAVNITTRTATQLATELGADAGSSYEFIVHAVVAQTLSMVAGSGVTAASDLTGGTDLSVTASSAGVFKLTFLSTTAAILSRIA